MRRLLPLLILLAGCPTPPEDPIELSPSDLRWLDWVEQEQDDAVAALAEPVVDCTQRTDTSFGVFHGCYDWHSAVHGVYALHAVSALLDEPSYLAVADGLLTEQAIADERATIEQGGPLNEIPYGYAWFLQLAEARGDAGRDDLDALADVVADQLATWVADLPPGAAESAVLSDDYGSAPWAVVNLHAWAERSGEDALAADLVDFVRDEVLPADCALEDEDDYSDDFFPPCLHRALVLTRVLPADEVLDWLDGWVPDDPRLDPVEEFSRPHPAGLNFSRAWGLWALFESTGDPVWRDLWLDHVQTHLDLTDYWREDYAAHSHWVPQFGIHAIAQTR